MRVLASVVSFAFLFISAFDPQIPLLPNGVGFTLLSTIILLPFGYVKCCATSSNSRYFLYRSFPFFVIFNIALLFILARILMNGGENFPFLLSFVKAFFVFLSCLLVYLVFFADKEPELFVKFLIGVYVSNAVINFIAGTHPDVFEFLEMFRGASISDRLGSNPYRDSFLSGSGYYSIGTAYGLMIILFCFYLARAKSKSLVYTVSVGLISIAGFVAARTAFFGISAGFIYLFHKRFGYFLLSFLVLVLATYFFLSLPAIEPYRIWLLSFFRFMGSASGAHLVNEMYFYPGDKVLLFGFGSVNDGRFPYTDAGFMQDIIFGGILFLLVKMSFIAVFFFSLFKKYPFLVILVVLSVMAFHFKGLFIYNNAHGMAAFYFIFFVLHSFRVKDGKKF